MPRRRRSGMPETSPRLPPLNTLRVFWAVMRHGSFRAASEALLVSPQAVSQQIRQLETFLGQVLFDRSGRRIQPTEAAILLSHHVEAGFAEFGEGVRRTMARDQTARVSVNVSPYFATRYLLPRLDRFRARMPQADLRMTTRVEAPDFAQDEADVAIQWGFGGDHPDETRLVADPKVLCCAPSLAPQIRTADDLARQTLLYPVRAPGLWDKVLRHLGADGPATPAMLEFHDAETMRRAAISGLGVGLLSAFDAARDIRENRLAAPLGLEALAKMDAADIPAFFLVAPRSRRRRPAVAAFCDWVLSEDWAAIRDDP